MSKITNKIVFLFVIIQAISAGMIYLYTKKNKWSIVEEMTVFIYPIFSFLIFIFIALSFIFSLIYFIYKYNKDKKLYCLLPVLFVSFLIIFSNIFFSDTKLKQYNFISFKSERKEIIKQIIDGDLKPDETGVILLPNELKNNEMARGGCVYIVEYKSKNGVYFCTFSGVLDSTAGFVFLSEKFNSFNYINNSVLLFENYDESWYYCGTDS